MLDAGIQTGKAFFVGRLKPLPDVPRCTGRIEPTIPDSKAWFASISQAGDAQRGILLNKSKRCERCGKTNASAMPSCNNCGVSLMDTETTLTTNIFAGFMLGIGAAGKVPLLISIRRESPESLVFDDSTPLAPLHFNAVPTSCYIPDWRYLLRRPKEGLKLLTLLSEECFAAAEQHFLSRPDWCDAAIRGGRTLPRDAFMMGFNYPPSQSQLHLQFIAPMLLPFQRLNFLRSMHLTRDRYVPATYVARVLAAASAAAGGVDVIDRTDDLFKFIQARFGVDYDAMYEEAFDRARRGFEEYAAWSAEQFSGVAVEGTDGVWRLHASNADTEGTPIADLSALVKQDKLQLQSYGRPYDPCTGEPTGSYYSFPKNIRDIDPW